eukprot:CAMPEP_0202064654 /NCGR_PEP_ID=MMETSP0963-20130614/49512_1 /ASSEMBLY_ACC=CAM_ASM_000494 /TAXON_ID=4773 /ORGANISM="Schizochytrium aggregatum, Strain ATCC28209" /LENGTH=40 /DNA_ID= /DNA_START= /DNA_END= /DNA_ORIENTATION=
MAEHKTHSHRVDVAHDKRHAPGARKQGHARPAQVAGALSL